MTDIQMGAAEQREARAATEPKTKPKKLATNWKPHKLGNTDFYLQEEAIEALAIAAQMKKLGHAIGWDTRLHHDGRFQMSSVIHYLTCSCNQAKAPE